MGCFFFFLLGYCLEFFTKDFCSQIPVWCADNLIDLRNSLLLILLISFPVFLFSLITYKMRNEVFEYWMKFAKWAIPTTMIIFFFIGTIPRGSGLMSGMVEAFFYLLALGIFCIVSLWRIAKKYIELKKR